MKRYLVFLLLLPFLTACPPPRDRREDSIKEFRKNHYNLTPLRKAAYRNIRFEVPQMLETDYSKSHVFRSTAYTLTEYQLGINFTVERFLDNDIYSELMIDQVVTKDLLNTFHDAYVTRRVNSLDGGTASYKKKVYNPLKFDGVIQTITAEPKYQYDQHLYYITATMKVEKEYYVFQLISEKDMMAYLYDDFVRILASVRKIK